MAVPILARGIIARLTSTATPARRTFRSANSFSTDVSSSRGIGCPFTVTVTSGKRPLPFWAQSGYAGRHRVRGTLSSPLSKLSCLLKSRTEGPETLQAEDPAGGRQVRNSVRVRPSLNPFSVRDRAATPWPRQLQCATTSGAGVLAGEKRGKKGSHARTAALRAISDARVLKASSRPTLTG